MTQRESADKNIQHPVSKSPRKIARKNPETFQLLKYFCILRNYDETEIFEKKKEKDMELMQR